MTTRPETTPWARDAARRAHVAIAREVWRETPFDINDIYYYLDLGADAGLTIAETLSVVDRALGENRRPDEELERLAALQSFAPEDITPEEVRLLQDDITEVLARAMVRYLARKAREAVEAHGEETDHD